MEQIWPGDVMKDLFNEKVKVLAERNGWSVAHAKGYVDGDIAKRRGKTPSKYAQIGIDEYCLGFRAAYYERRKPEATQPTSGVVPAGGQSNRGSRGSREI